MMQGDPVISVTMSRDNEGLEYQPVTGLRGVGPAVAQKLEKLGIHTLQDVLFHLPMRYEDRTRRVPIGALRPGQQALVEGVIEHSEVRPGGGRRRSLLCRLSDNTGAITLRFFHFNARQQARLARGARLRCFGEARPGLNRLEMVHPECQGVGANTPLEQSLTPVYPKTEGVHQGLLKKLSDQVLQRMRDEGLPDWLPADIARRHGFPDLATALLAVHRPAADADVAALLAVRTPAQQRLIFEELLAHQLSLLLGRRQIRQQAATALPAEDGLLEAFEARLGFRLTHAQRRVCGEIFADLQQNRPMLRLVQGDVGSGKTAVAAAAAAVALAHGRQTAVMAPTEILAEQHAINFRRWFGETACVLLTGRDKGKRRAQKLAAIASGEAAIVLGTHALFQDDVRFRSLALMVVDEQHRFGVHQRLALREKGLRQGLAPHQLIMTATPIPRSLAMTAYADLDYSVIDELPAGRKPVTTVVVSNNRRDEVVARIHAACARGEQAYWVCTLVEESEFLQCEAAQDTAEKLAAELRGLRVGLVHGRMKQEDKQAVVARFKQGEIDLLVATTVIEVGVDVPNASLMVIENAERLGLAQLHQLRGRIGRGDKQSACVLMYQPPLSQTVRQRLSILRESQDGFRVAEKDLELRGPGEVLGTRQTGLMRFRIADLLRDEHWLTAVKTAAETIVGEHPDAAHALVRRWIGAAGRFANV